MKIINKLKFKLKEWLGINSLEKDYAEYKLKIKKELFNHEHNIGYCEERIKENKSAINTLYNTIENVVHIGTDVRQYEQNNHSWAVVCIEGKINIVKFVDLRGQNYREILSYLKQFEAGRYCIDTPNSEVFYDNLFKF